MISFNKTSLLVITMMNWLLSILLYMTWYLFVYFGIESMFMIHVSSKQMVLNLGRVASVLMILVTTFQWTRTNWPRVLRMYSTSYLFIMTFMVEWIFIISHKRDFISPSLWKATLEWMSVSIFSCSLLLCISLRFSWGGVLAACGRRT